MNIIFAQNLKNLRKENDLSQQAIAKVVCASQQCVSNLENGKIEPNLYYLWKLADFFEISIDELIGRNN